MIPTSRLLVCSTLSFMGVSHRRNEEGDQGGPLPPPNKEQNWENKEQNGGKSFKMGPFWGMVIHENTCCKTKFKS